MGSLAHTKPELLNLLHQKKSWDEKMAGRIDPYLKRKWEYAFSTFFDVNKDKVLEWDDFELLLERIKTTRGVDSLDYKKEAEGMRKIWDELRRVADENNDSVVTEQEWQMMWFDTIASGKKETEGWQKLYLDYMFHLFDSSGDGFIDLSEYIEMMAHYSIDRRRAIWSFDKFAISNDGRQLNMITYEMFTSLWRDFFYSIDLAAKGNFLFGDVSNQFNPLEVQDTIDEDDGDEMMENGV